MEISPDQDDAYHLRAHIFASQQKFKLAMADFDKAVELEPKDGYHYYCRGEFQRRHLRKGRKAIKDLAIAKALLPEKVQAHFAYIRALRDSRRHKRARSIYLREVTKQPDNSALLVSYAYVCMLNNNFDEAEEYLKHSFISQVEDPMVAFYQLWIARACRKWGLLWRYYRGVLSYDEDFAWEYLLHVYTYIPLPKFLRRLIYWSIKSGITKPKLGFKIRNIWPSRLRNRGQMITERDLALA